MRMNVRFDVNSFNFNIHTQVKGYTQSKKGGRTDMIQYIGWDKTINL